MELEYNKLYCVHEISPILLNRIEKIILDGCGPNPFSLSRIESIEALLDQPRLFGEDKTAASLATFAIYIREKFYGCRHFRSVHLYRKVNMYPEKPFVMTFNDVFGWRPFECGASSQIGRLAGIWRE